MNAQFVSKLVGKHSAIALAVRCIKESAFVEITPLPCDLYEVSVKPDREHLLRTRYNVLTLKGMNVSSSSIFAVTMAEAAEKVRGCGERVCFVGTHEASAEPCEGTE